MAYANRHAELRPKCGGCGARIGEKHTEGCDVARCLLSGGQYWVCDDSGHPGKCKRDTWTGLWSGTAECIEYGWYAHLTPLGWQACGPELEDSHPDINRLLQGCRWDADARRWQRV